MKKQTFLDITVLVAGTVGVFFKESHQTVFNVVFYRCLFGAIFLDLFCYFKGYFKHRNLTLLRLTLVLLSGISLILNWVLIFKSLLTYLMTQHLWRKLKVVQQRKVHFMGEDWLAGNYISANRVLDDLFKYLVKLS